MHAQVFLWMGDHLAAFFALPPSRALVGDPPKGGGVALRQAVRPDLVAGLQALNVAGPAGRTAAGSAEFPERGRGRGRGRFGARGSGGLSARARANAWIQRAGQLSAVSDNGAAVESQDAQDGGHDAPHGGQQQQASVPAAAVLRNDGGAAARGRGGGGARGGKKGGGQAKANMPVAAKTQREMLWDGNNVGKLPNMMWRAVSMEDLRMHPHFVGLPGSSPNLLPN